MYIQNESFRGINPSEIIRCFNHEHYVLEKYINNFKNHLVKSS